MTQGVQDLIKAIVEGDSTDIESAFNAEMATRISTKLDDMRVSVAQSMFKTEEVEEDEAELTEEQVDEILDLISEEDMVEIEAITEEQIEEASYSAKAARAGKDIGKPGKNFAKIAAKAGEKYGSAERGRKVAGAILAKLRKEEVEEIEEAGTFTGKIVKGIARVGNELKDAGKGAAELGGQAVGTVAKTVGAVAALPGATKAAYQQGKANTYNSVAK